MRKAAAKDQTVETTASEPARCGIHSKRRPDYSLFDRQPQDQDEARNEDQPQGKAGCEDNEHIFQSTGLENSLA
jgi:hypothetical protein